MKEMLDTAFYTVVTHADFSVSTPLLKAADSSKNRESKVLQPFMFCVHEQSFSSSWWTTESEKFLSHVRAHFGSGRFSSFLS
jgi:hypothetical protein